MVELSKFDHLDQKHPKPDLLPCPLCGSDRIEFGQQRIVDAVIWCRHCGLTLEREMLGNDTIDGVTNRLIRLWNKRSTPVVMRDSWIETASGDQALPFRGVGVDFIGDIAHSLAYICRFNGHIKPFYSVAQHSIIVAGALPKKLRLAGLLHDACEAFVGDMVAPIKGAFPAYAQLADRLQRQIWEQFGIEVNDLAMQEIKRVDRAALLAERRDLLSDSGHEWAVKGDPLPAKISPMLPKEAKSLFLAKFKVYSGHDLV